MLPLHSAPLGVLIALRTAVVFAAVAVLATVTGLLELDPEHAAPPKRERPVAAVKIPPGHQPDYLYAAAVSAEAYYAEIERLEQERIAAYLAEQAAEQAAERARVEAARRAPSTPAPSGRNYGAHSDAWWQAVAVCEQSGRNDPYYGYFSIMDGSAGGRDWATQVTMANAIIARAGDGAWAASCVAAGYRASPGG